MPYLANEKIRLQAEAQAAAAEISTLTAQLNTQQQALAAAQARVNTARSSLTDAQAQIPALAASAAAADQRVADLTHQIDVHETNEPEQFIERINKPPLINPEWTTWNKKLDLLTQRRNHAQADATAAHAGLNQGQAAVSQAQAGVQTAEHQAGEATAAVQATQLAIAAAHQRQDATQQQVAELERWNTEIVRDPLDRTVLEPVAAELSKRSAVLEEAYAIAGFQNEEAEQNRASLVARRNQLVLMLNDVNGHLPAAQAELQAAQSALAAVARSIEKLLHDGP